MEAALFRVLCLSALVAVVFGNCVPDLNTTYAIDDNQVTKCCAIGDNGQRVIGVCGNMQQHLGYCPPLKKYYKSRKFSALRPHLCSEPGALVAKVCCDLTQYIGAPKQEPEQPFRRWNNFGLLPHGQCGKNRRPVVADISDRIIGGNYAEVAQFPWMARIGFKNGMSNEFACGGSIVSKRYILTAAHCFDDAQDRGRLVVRLGAHNVSHNEMECITQSKSPNSFKFACSTPQDFEVEEVIKHSGYGYPVGSDAGQMNDIALIRLAKDIDFQSYFMQPICLPFVNEYRLGQNLDDTFLIQNAKKGAKLQVAGWGLENYDNFHGSPLLKYAHIALKPLVSCKFVYRSYNVTKEMLCVGGDKGTDSCAGDSGGPLMVALDDKAESVHYQVGIVSYGRRKCGKGGSPTIYTRVRNYLPWILSNLRP